MSNVGNKIKGAASTFHGIGESIRGTALGAVDTIAHDKEGEMKNDAIGQKGKLEAEQGMQRMRMSGHPIQATTTAPGAPSAGISDYPKHHRDDEVFNDSQARAVYQGTESQQMADTPRNAPPSANAGV
ncbi:hypothetical protein D9757_002294 [Collybiopsis confluens]|uniref:Uncharacterized protein n=1 Tax=Collybiopsis confluens TaxID=2823264 RepID=A0A8H5HZS1_9AGAR|nr:hypothetical protein D9757_002294 [Collybiopsis confluens]